MTNLLLKKPTAIDTAKVILPLVKLGLALSDNPAAVMLGTFLDSLLLTGLQKWEQQSSEVLKTDNSSSSPIAVQATPTG